MTSLSSVSSASSVNRLNRLLYGLAVIAVFISAVYAIRYCGQPILERHSFRQTQTALSAVWIKKHPLVFPYETPVVGYPWAVPFEFPFYQYVVAALSGIIGSDLQKTGRLTSYGFLLLSILPVASILKSLFPKQWRQHTAIFVAILFTSPIYLFWGRAFLIETAALFLTLCAIRTALPFIRLEWVPSDVMKLALCLTLALLQKVTTAAPAWLLLVSLTIFSRLTREKKLNLNWRAYAQLAMAFIVPFLIADAWVIYSDAVKQANPIGKFMTSSIIAPFNYGTLAQRFSPHIYKEVLWSRVAVGNVAGPVGISFLVAGLFFLSGLERRCVWIAVLFFLLPFWIFENIHWIHDYYQAAIAIYLIFAVSLSLSCLMNGNEKLRWAGLLSVVVIMGSNLWCFKHGYAGLEKVEFDNNTQTLAVSRVIRNSTEPESPILIFGYDYSSEVPFFSHRRGLAVPSWLPRDYNRDVLARPTAYLGSIPSAIVTCPPTSVDPKEIARFFPEYREVQQGTCWIFVKN